MWYCSFQTRRRTTVFSGITMGIGILAGTFYLIWWNEMNDDCTKLAYADAKSQMVESNCSYIPENNGLFVHLTCDVDLSKLSVSDFGTGVTVNGSWAIKATTEEYQWHETTYSHRKNKKTFHCSCFDHDWYSSYQSISTYATQCSGSHGLPTCIYENVWTNPKYRGKDSATGIGSYLGYADHVLLQSDFEISSDQVHKISGGKRSRVYPPSTVIDHTGYLWILHNSYYLYSNIGNAYIGDRRISLTSISSSMISVLGIQNFSSPATLHAKKFGGSKHPYCEKKSILVFEAGDKSGSAMFKGLNNEINKNTIYIRVLSFALLWVALSFIVFPIYSFSEVIPLIGSCLGEVALCLLVVCSCTVAIAIWLVCTGICWIFYRPQAGPITLSIGIIIFFTILISRLCLILKRRPRYKISSYSKPLAEDILVYSDEIVVPTTPSQMSRGEDGSSLWRQTLKYSDEGR